METSLTLSNVTIKSRIETTFSVPLCYFLNLQPPVLSLQEMQLWKAPSEKENLFFFHRE